MLKSEFKAARSAHRLELRMAFRKCYPSFKEVLSNRSQIIKDCEKPIDRMESAAIWHFKTTRLGYTYDHNTHLYSKKSL
jgi:hypothetical protein